MASLSLLNQDEFSCPICLDLLKNPVTIPCGHSFCLSCISGCWDQEDQLALYSCPQCRKAFSPRPVLSRNVILAGVVDKLKTELLSVCATPSYAGPGDVVCDFCDGKKRRAVKSCLTCLISYCETHVQAHYQVPGLSKHQLVNATANIQERFCSNHDRILEAFCRTDEKLICLLCSLDDHHGHKSVSAAAEHTEKQKELAKEKTAQQQHIHLREKEQHGIRQALESLKASSASAIKDTEQKFKELIMLIKQKCSEVVESIRDQERAEVQRAEGLLEMLDLEITALKKREEKMEKLLQTEDHTDFLLNFGSIGRSITQKCSRSVTFTANISLHGLLARAFTEIKSMVSKFEPGLKLGDKVRVKGCVANPMHGWGNVSHCSVGVIKGFLHTGHMTVDFPEAPDWYADPSELELVL